LHCADDGAAAHPDDSHADESHAGDSPPDIGHKYNSDFITFSVGSVPAAVADLLCAEGEASCALLADGHAPSTSQAHAGGKNSSSGSNGEPFQGQYQSQRSRTIHGSDDGNGEADWEGSSPDVGGFEDDVDHSDGHYDDEDDNNSSEHITYVMADSEDGEMVSVFANVSDAGCSHVLQQAARKQPALHGRARTAVWGVFREHEWYKHTCADCVCA
jgi:hypothetical protein